MAAGLVSLTETGINHTGNIVRFPRECKRIAFRKMLTLAGTGWPGPASPACRHKIGTPLPPAGHAGRVSKSLEFPPGFSWMQERLP